MCDKHLDLQADVFSVLEDLQAQLWRMQDAIRDLHVLVAPHHHSALPELRQVPEVRATRYNTDIPE